MIDMSWKDSATPACADPKINPAIFFPGKDERPVEARRVCFRCPLRIACRDHAIIHHEDGIWGGTTDYERKLIRRLNDRRLA